MESSEPTSAAREGSKEAAALAALNATYIEPPRPRRVRRRRRSLRRRLIDSLMPFAVLVGLTVFAAGLVSVVEIGAAKSSKVKSVYNGEVTSYEQPPEMDYENVQQGYYDLMRKHAEHKAKKKPVTQVAYQLGLANEAIRDLSGLDAVVPSEEPQTPASAITDWDLFEQGSEDPRSTLQRRGASPTLP